MGTVDEGFALTADEGEPIWLQGGLCVIKVPGAFEIPFGAREAASRGHFAAVVCLGCLIRGKTPHFEYISSACAHGITDAAASTGVPMSFGVLTTNSIEEALERAVDGPTNKGWEAAMAAVEMATLQRSLRQPRPSKSINV